LHLLLHLPGFVFSSLLHTTYVYLYLPRKRRRCMDGVKLTISTAAAAADLSSYMHDLFPKTAPSDRGLIIDREKQLHLAAGGGDTGRRRPGRRKKRERKKESTFKAVGGTDRPTDRPAPARSGGVRMPPAV
jgi:hypothetical protein